jgi:hypothetical protein
LTHSRHRLFVVVDKNITAWRVEEVLAGLGYTTSHSTSSADPLHGELFESPDSNHSDVILLLSESAGMEANVQERCPQCKVLHLARCPEAIPSFEITCTIPKTLPKMPLPFDEILKRIQDAA